MGLILGVNYTQDASICLIGDSEIYATRKERFDKIKHSWGSINDFENFYLDVIKSKNRKIDLIVDSYSSDPIREKKLIIRSKINSILNYEPEYVEVNHHLAHLYSAIPFKTDKNAIGIVIDCMGSFKNINKDEFKCNLDNKELNCNEIEICSIYEINEENEVCLKYKQYWDGNWKEPKGLGAFYYLLTKCFFNQVGTEGKVMGFSSYGNEDEISYPPLLIKNGFEVSIPIQWLDIFEETGRLDFSNNSYWSPDGVIVKSISEPNLTKSNKKIQKYANMALAGQKAFEDALSEVIKFATTNSKSTEIVYTGGIALNCVANGTIAKNYKNLNFNIPSWPDDGGTSIGAAIYGSIKKGKYRECFKKIDFKLDYIGNKCENSHHIVSNPIYKNRIKEISFHNDDMLIDEIVNRLIEGHVIGIINGLSEFGPRALGNRSLLADPRSDKIRDFINFHIKGREWFRPVAPIAIEEYANCYFDIYAKSNYMQYAVDVKIDKKNSILGVCHVDDTSRIQMINRDDNQFVYGILNKFYSKTNIPMLINTSLNPKGATIVEDFNEALNMLINTDMNSLVVNSKFYIKK